LEPGPGPDSEYEYNFSPTRPGLKNVHLMPAQPGPGLKYENLAWPGPNPEFLN